LPRTSSSTECLDADPADATKTALVGGGTSGNDTIVITPADPAGKTLPVSINGAVQPGGPFAPTGHLVYGQTGNDTIQVAAATINVQSVLVAVPALLFGGSGNSTLSFAGSSTRQLSSTTSAPPPIAVVTTGRRSTSSSA
jgi:hypothetical protein